MSEAPTGAVWRKRMQDWSRQAGLPHPPLWAPLAFGVAAQIEAIPVLEMARDGTRLRKNLSELQRVLRTDAVVCAVPSAMEVEALGLPMADTAWPPRPVGALAQAGGEVDAQALLSRGVRLAASVDAVRQLQADGADRVVVAALTGPATLVAQLRAAQIELDDESLYDYAGRVLAALAGLYAQAGVQVLQWHETHLPDEAVEDHWKGALGTAGNMARFHRVVPLLVVAQGAPASWPAQASACPTVAQQPPPAARAHGRAWPGEPADWPESLAAAGSARLLTTVTEIPVDLPIAQLKTSMDRVRGR